MPTSITRDDLARLQGISPKLLRALEELFVNVASTAATVEGQVAATGSLQSATVLTLSSNAAFDNERIVKEGSGIKFTVTDDSLTISSTSDIATNGGYKLTFNLIADTSLDLPVQGRVATTTPPGPYSSDSAAASGGVGVGEIYYKTGGVAAVRVS